MKSARENATATVLPDGRVLIAGGWVSGIGFPGIPLASAEMYDPAAGTFSPTGSMNAAREFAVATLLPDSRVLIAGGEGSAPLASAELYDPKTGAFAPTGSLAVARDRAAATELPDNHVLIVGGDTGGTAELYDPATGKFSSTGSTSAFRTFATATLLRDGRVLVAGGSGGAVVVPLVASTLASAELFMP
jgi:hypothetical protein